MQRESLLKSAQDMKERVFKWLVLVVGFALFVAVGIRAVHDATTADPASHRSDFSIYHSTGRAVLDGTNIYEAHSIRGMLGSTLPIFPIAMVPLALLPPLWATVLWYLFTVATMAHAVYLAVLLTRRFLPQWRWGGFWLYATMAVLVLAQAMTGASRGNPSTLVTWLIMVSLWLYCERRTWLAGFCLAASVVVKLFPLLLLAYFVWKRRWLMSVATTVWLLVLIWGIPSLVFGVRGNQALLEQWLRMITLPRMSLEQTQAMPQTSGRFRPSQTTNQALPAMVVKWVTGSTAETSHSPRAAAARWLAVLSCVVVTGLSVWACWRSKGAPDHAGTLRDFCIAMCLMLFLSPVSWFHHFTLLMLPLAVVLALAGDASMPRRQWIFQANLALYEVVSVLVQAVHGLLVFGVFLCGTIYLWASFIWAWPLPENDQECCGS